jgi:hypothetical protein
MNVLIAYDSSGSTYGAKTYHRITQSIVSKYPKARIISWNNTWKEISHHELKRINTTEWGDGGTQINCVATSLLTLNFQGQLILITDGGVDTQSIDRCDRMLQNFKGITIAETHIIGSFANMSVSCPFTRYCPHTVYTYNSNQETPNNTVHVSEEDLNTLNTIDTIQSINEFESKYDTILKAITARMMGRLDIDIKIHDQVVKLKKRLHEEHSKNNTNAAGNECRHLENLIHDEAHFDEAKTVFRNIINQYYTGSSLPLFAQQLNDLINITKGGLRNVFNHSHRLRRAETTEQVQLPQIELSEEPFVEADFECPLSADEENDVVLMISVPDEPLLNTLQPNQLETLLNCPLDAFNYPELLKSLVNCFDMACGLSSLKRADKQNLTIQTSPLTRRELVGSIYFGKNKSQMKATNHTIANLLTGKVAKKAGNLDLWYAVIYFLLSKIERYNDILPFAKEHLTTRLNESLTWASMSGQLKYLNVKVPLGVACWMIATSPVLNLPVQWDMSRAHIFHMDIIFDLVDMYGARIPDNIYKFLKEHAVRVKTMFKLLHICKKNKEIFNQVGALYQQSVRLSNGRWIPIDGPAPPQQIEKVLLELQTYYGISKIKQEDIIQLMETITPNSSAESIVVPFEWKSTSKAYNVSWSQYGLKQETVTSITPICSNTVRPFYYIGSKEKTWKNNFEDTYHFDAEQCFPGHAWYINFVQRHKRFPENEEEYIEFCYLNCVNRDIKTLPAPVKQFACEIFESYRTIVKEISIEDFIQRANKSVCIEDRIRLEV